MRNETCGQQDQGEYGALSRFCFLFVFVFVFCLFVFFFEKKKKNHKVGGKDYAVQSTLGEGAFAFVYKCKGSDGALVAVKCLACEDSALAQDAVFEANLFRSVSFHPYLVKFVDSETRRVGRLTEVVIVQELLGDSLFSLMQKKSERPNDFFEDSFVLLVVSQIGSALAHLHSNDIFHRDVKPENVLLASKSPRNLWKLCDFGSARRGVATPSSEEQRSMMEREIETKTSLSYRAPEMLDLFRGHPIGGPADVWALGVTMYYATFLVQPFPDGHLAILNGKLSFPGQRGPINQLVTLALAQDPAARPSANSLHSSCERALLGDVANFAPVSPRTVPAGSPRVSQPITVKKVVPLDPELASLVKAATTAAPQQHEEPAKPPPPSVAPSVPPPANNDALLAEAKRCLADIKGKNTNKLFFAFFVFSFTCFPSFEGS